MKNTTCIDLQGLSIIQSALLGLKLVVGNKNDFNDAAGIFDVVTRPNKHVVSIKAIEQQDIQLVHKIREGLVGKRTALVNQVRGLLSERGIIIPKGINKVRVELPLILEDAENNLTALSREMFAEQYEKLVALDEEVKNQDRRIGRLSTSHQLISQRFLDVLGVGAITATIVASDIGNGKGYQSSRDYAASLGIVPKQHSSGDKQVYLGISKRGNRYSAPC